MKIYFVVCLLNTYTGPVLEVHKVVNHERWYPTLNDYVEHLKSNGYIPIEWFERDYLHLKERIEYSHDMKNNPYQLWEFSNDEGYSWIECIPQWSASCLYRRKKKTQTIWHCIVLNSFDQRMPVVCYEDQQRHYKNNSINWKEYLESIHPIIGEIHIEEI